MGLQKFEIKWQFERIKSNRIGNEPIWNLNRKEFLGGEKQKMRSQMRMKSERKAWFHVVDLNLYEGRQSLAIFNLSLNRYFSIKCFQNSRWTKMKSLKLMSAMQKNWIKRERDIFHLDSAGIINMLRMLVDLEMDGEMELKIISYCEWPILENDDFAHFPLLFSLHRDCLLCLFFRSFFNFNPSHLSPLWIKQQESLRAAEASFLSAALLCAL